MNEHYINVTVRLERERSDDVSVLCRTVHPCMMSTRGRLVLYPHLWRLSERNGTRAQVSSNTEPSAYRWKLDFSSVFTGVFTGASGEKARCVTAAFNSFHGKPSKSLSENMQLQSEVQCVRLKKELCVPV